MQRNSASPEDYINSIEGSQKDLLVGIRDLIHEVIPDAEETIEYGMLGYSGIGNLAAQKNYVSLYVAPKALAAFKKEHPSSNCGKSCLRFGSDKDFDADAVHKLLSEVHRISQNGESSGCC